MIYVHQKVIFLRHSAPKSHFLTVTQSVQIGGLGASIVNFAVRPFLRQMTF